MSITPTDLLRVLEGLSAVLPYAKQLNEAAVLLIWGTFPEKAKAELTPAALQYAAMQRMLDPEPPKELPLHVQLLRYLYRLENGQPNLSWGLKADLPQRMQAGGVFHGEAPSQWQLEAEQGPGAHDVISPEGALRRVGWRP